LTVLQYLTTTRPHSTETEWEMRIERGEVEVDDRRVRGDTTLLTGHTIVWHRPPWDEPTVPTEFELLHQDEAILVISKPRGLPTLPAGGFLEQTLLALVRRQFPEASPLHRLGRHTSGLVLFARTPGAASHLAQAWRDHHVIKTYRALGHGVARVARIEIDAPIGPVPHPRIGTVYAASERGKPSHSVATALEIRNGQTLFNVEIATGRPHQIRIHLAFAGHPLVGDPIYVAGGGLNDDPGLPGDGGYFLHAERLLFLHPVSGERTTVSASPPAELQTRRERVG